MLESPILPAHMQKAGQSDEVRDLKRKIRRKMIEMEQVLLLAVNKWIRFQTETFMDDFDAAGATQTITKADEIDIFVQNFTDWELLTEGGISFTRPAISEAFGAGGKIAFDLAEFVPFPFDPLKVSSAAFVDEICSTMVTAVTDETRRAVNAVIRNGLEKGKGWKAVGRELRPKVGLSEQMIGWSANREEKLLIRGDLSRKQVDDRIAAYERKLHRMRNETIARTESARAMNAGQLQGFAEADVDTVFWFALADRCPICDPRDGEEFDIRNASGVLPYHPRCYDKITEVYTEHGWQPIKDVGKGTSVLTLEPETKDLEWHEVVATTAHHESHLYHITNKQHSFDMMVTEDHPFFIYKRVQKNGHRRPEPMFVSGVQDLDSESQFYLSSKWQGENPLIITINGLNFRADEYCVLMGYYLSEGSVVRRESGRYQISISQQTHLFEMWDDLKNLPVRKLWLGKDKIYIPDNLLGEYLMQFGKSHEKFVPDEIKALAPQYIRIFLDAYNLGDGTVKAGKNWKDAKFADSISYCTSSKRMADDLGELIIKSGKAVSYRFEERAGRVQKFANGTYTINHDLWVINELTSKYRMFVSMSATKVEYNDYVYDIEVARNHTVLTRRNGRVVWGSNCRCMWLTRRFASQGPRLAA